MKSKTNLMPMMAFWGLGIIWGSNFIFMKWAANLITPIQIVWWRVLFGFIPILLYAWSKKLLRKSHLKYIGHFAVMSFLATSLYYYGFAKGTSLLPSGIAGAISGAIPLFSFLSAIVFISSEKATTLRTVGILVGFIGLLLIADPFKLNSSIESFHGIAFMLMGSLSLGLSFVYARKYLVPKNIPAPALVTYQLGLGLFSLTLVTDFEGASTLFIEVKAATALILGLGFLGTGLAYIIYYYIVKHLGAVTASSVTYVPPVVALLIGSVIAKEPISWLDYLFTGMILLGVMLMKKDTSNNEAKTT